jgi:hypothetical protein
MYILEIAGALIVAYLMFKNIGNIATSLWNTSFTGLIS